MNLKKLDYIQYICEQRLKKYNLHENQKYVQRLERELTNIDVQNLQDYVFNLLDKEVKVDHHGSLVYYLLGISNQDPIATNQPLKIKKQASFPDIDSDFSINERGQVIKYFIDKYGSDHVAAIGSYGQMKMKSVIRDVARIYDIDLTETNEVAKNLQDDVDNMSEEEFDILIAKESTDEGFRKDLFDLRLYLDKHSELREIIFLLKGQLRHLTKHPAGVVATPTKINETIPLMKHKNELITSWVDGIFRKDLQSSGFIKFDILGLKTLTIIKEILELIRSRQHYNKDADFDISDIDKNQMISLLYEEFSTKLPLDGNDVIYERFRTTETNGIFQFECIAGYTWIGNNKIENLYQKFIKGEELDKIASADIKKQQKIRQRIIAMKKQRKRLYRVVLVNSQCIDVTILHKFYTKRGWEELQDIKIGDRVLIDQGKNRIQYACSYCNEIIDHIGVCKTCAKTGKHVTVKNVLSQFKQYKKRFKFMKIKNIIPLGFEDVYDIAVENKPHNYIANGFVVHNSNLMKSLLKEIKPTSFMDITSATALGRPGPLDMGMHHEYAARKNGKAFDFGHKLIEKCLKESYGILVYQEDVMRLCNIVAGFPLDLTDTVRKNLMKSIRDGDARDKSAKEREKLYKMFIQGCEKNGLSKETAESWWQGCVSFTRYGFNKCLTGDTVVTRCNGNQHTKRNITIDELYFLMRSQTKVGRKYRRSGYPKIHSMIDGRVKIEKIKDIVYNGERPVFKITTDNGFFIKATDNHRFLSESGWEEVKDFKIGEKIAITLQEYDGYKRKGYSDRVEGETYENDGPGFGEGKNNPAYIDGRSILKHENIEKLKQAHSKCQDCGREHRRLEAHHKQRLIAFDYDRIKYHDESNLLILCPSCHKKRHYEMGRTKRYQKGFEVIYATIANIELIGIEKVYDLEMYGDEHNFVANGFISHNSHAVSYTILSYQMMWFKVYYPLEFYVVLFSNSLKDKFTSYFAEAMNKGINIVPADINKARESFTIHGEDTIMFGLAHITNIGPAVVDVIIRSQPFANFQDFFDKTATIKKVGKGAVEALINAHVFDCFGAQNEILEQYFTRIREEKDWTREVDYEDKKFEHEMFVESYGLDWRTKLTDEQKAIIKQFEAKSLTKVVSPKPRLKLYVYGIVNEVIKKTSRNGNDYFNIILTDAKFNMAKLRIPIYNRRSKHAKVLDRMTGKYKTVKINDVIQIGNILLGEAESSEYHNFIFVDLYEICCIGNIFERSKDQLDKLGKYDKIYDEIDIHEKEY